MLPVLNLRMPNHHRILVGSTSSASVFSVTSVYSEASSTTDDVFDRTRSRNGSIRSIGSDETEKVVLEEPDHGNVDQANGFSGSHKPASSSISMYNALPSPTPSVSMSVSNTRFSPLQHQSQLRIHPLNLRRLTRFSTGSFGSVRSISNLEAKQFDNEQVWHTCGNAS